MSIVSLFIILIELVAIVVLGYYLWSCKDDSKENLCLCQGNGIERHVDRSVRARRYNRKAFQPEFSGV